MPTLARSGLALAAALLLLAASPRAVGAHANYERSDPPANAVLEQAPRQVRVWFSEEPEPRFSEVQVYDTARRRLDRGDLTVVPGEPRALAVSVGDLAPGTYTVAWKVLSSVDGHTTRGAFPFTVGLDQTPAPMVLPPGAEAGATRVTPWGVASRWLNLLTAAIGAGAFVVLPGVVGGALRPLAVQGDESVLAGAWGVARRRGLLVAAWAAGLGLAAGVFALLVQAAVAADVEPWEVFGPPLATILGTRYSVIWLARMLLLGALVGLALDLRRPGTTARDPRWLAGAGLGALVLLTTSLNSHAAAAQQAVLLAVAVDWVHLIGTAVWTGGLIQLTVALPPALFALPAPLRGRLLAAALPRFSALAVAMVGALVATGLYQTWLTVGSVEALTTTPYGQALGLKLLLLVPLLALGAANLLIVSPRVAALVGRGARAALERYERLERGFRLVVAAEVVLAVALLGVVGLLTSLEPARDAVRAQGITRSIQAEDVRAVLRVAPGEAGLNTFDVALFVAGRPEPEAQRVTLRLTHRDMDMGITEQRLEPTGDGHYRAVSGALSMAGNWDVMVIVRLAGRDDVRGEMQLTALEPGAARYQPGGSAGAALPPPRLLAGAVLLGLGVLFAVEAIRPRGRRRRQAATALLGAVAAALGVVLGAAAALQPQPAEAVIPNPVPATAASIARGQDLYAQNCVVCHGVNGRGDGPLAATLNPRPADLRVHVSQHTEGQLWLWISDGFPGSAMPAFRASLSEEDRWHLVNYLRSRFGGQTVAQQP
jgi:copper transport protein